MCKPGLILTRTENLMEKEKAQTKLQLPQRLGHRSFKQNSIFISQEESQRLDRLRCLHHPVIVVAGKCAMPKLEMTAYSKKPNLKRAVSTSELGRIGNKYASSIAQRHDAAEENG